MTGHSSNNIKKILNDAAGVNGSDKDWKRQSKSRNDNGEWERVFEHTASGALVRATEHADGTLSASIIDDKDKSSINKKKAAKYCFAIGGSEGGFVNVAKDIMIYITPIAYFNKYKYCDDQPYHLYDLLPAGADDVNECGNYLMPHNGKTDIEIAKDLITRGFVWRSDLQDLVYKDLNAQSRSELTAFQATTMPRANPTIPKNPNR